MGKLFTRTFEAESDSHRGRSRSFPKSIVPKISRRDDETIRKSASNIIQNIMKDSPFFESNRTKVVPMFGHNEITLGKTLGYGKYGNVREVTKLGQRRGVSLHKLLISESAQSRLAIKNDDSCGSSCEEMDEQLTMLQAQCHRDGKARYALKQLRSDLEGERFQGAIDIAMEAKFLASLSHPNIVTLRATVGELGHPNFMFVLDRLYCTLNDQLNIWKKQNRRCFWKNKFKPLRSFSSYCHGAAGTTVAIAVGSHHHHHHHHGFFRERLCAAYDIARAMKYLHGHNILYRDLKPENIAYDARGDVRIFDFV